MLEHLRRLHGAEVVERARPAGIAEGQDGEASSAALVAPALRWPACRPESAGI